MAEGDPVLWVIPRYQAFRPSGYLVERQVGEGRLIVCALGLARGVAEGRYLLARMCEYLGGTELAQAPVLSEEGIARILAACALL